MKLNKEERSWRDELEKRRASFSMNDDYDTRIRALQEMQDLAVRLHQSLKQKGLEPKHHEYMIKNRGSQPDDPQFYFHLHPIEDLIKFTYDPHANDDSVDQTIDNEFEMRIFNRRWGHEDKYRIKRTASGWLLDAGVYSGPCDKSCSPLLIQALRHDSVQHPTEIGKWFEWLWQQAKEKGLSHDDIQGGINDIADWIHATEANTPEEGIWQGVA
jgi:hypothetical protein